MRFAGGFLEQCPVHGRKASIALGRGVDLGQMQAVCQRQHLAVQLAAADDKTTLRAQMGDPLQRGFHAGAGVRAHGGERGVTREHDVFAPGQRLRQRFPGLASHQHGVPQRERAKAAQIGGKPPGQAIVAANDAIAGNGGNQGNVRAGGGVFVHTATGAAMWGCGW